MIGGRTFLSAFALMAGGVLLSGCSGWSYAPPIHGNFMTEPWNHPGVDGGAPPAGGSFIQETAHDYAGLADYLAHAGSVYRGDWVDVDYFARKGMAAEHGALVPPEDNANWAIPLEQPYGFRTQMAQARVRLVTDLDHGGRDRFPGLAARAQVAYDCWLERTEDDWAKQFNGACHKDFIATITALEQALNGRAAAPAPGAHQYNVYFEFDRSTLTPEGRQVVDTVAQAAKSDHDVHLRLVGKADLTGTDPYNMALSHRRADAVRATLRADGVDNSRIEESWDGFRNPPVPTAPGVREPRNRVVEVTLN
ncbi:MAG TPA: OmpA family protein [Stellaceae bacterium]|nr:OmpA family protein [Stellaceae bacterium]